LDQLKIKRINSKECEYVVIFLSLKKSTNVKKHRKKKKHRVEIIFIDWSSLLVEAPTL